MLDGGNDAHGHGIHDARRPGQIRQGGGQGPDRLGRGRQGRVGIDPAALHGDVARAQIAFFQHVDRDAPGPGQADGVVVEGPLVADQDQVRDAVAVHDRGHEGRPVQARAPVAQGQGPGPVVDVAAADVDPQHLDAQAVHGQAQPAHERALRALEKQKRPGPGLGRGVEPGELAQGPAIVGPRAKRLGELGQEAQPADPDTLVFSHPAGPGGRPLRPGPPLARAPGAIPRPPGPGPGGPAPGNAGSTGKTAAGPRIPPPPGK